MVNIVQPLSNSNGNIRKNKFKMLKNLFILTLLLNMGKIDENIKELSSHNGYNITSFAFMYMY